MFTNLNLYYNNYKLLYNMTKDCCHNNLKQIQEKKI